eukprot:4057157-Amphidinium_carterae.2
MTDGNVQVAVYMDDISIMATCSSDLQLASGAAALFMKNWHVQLNISKCTMAMSVQAQRLWACDLEMSLANTFRLLGVDIGHSHSGEIMLERINEADSRLDRIMCLLGAPLSIKRKLVASFVCPVLYGSCFSRVPARAWGALYVKRSGASALAAVAMLLPAICAWEFATVLIGGCLMLGASLKCQGLSTLLRRLLLGKLDLPG